MGCISGGHREGRREKKEKAEKEIEEAEEEGNKLEPWTVGVLSRFTHVFSVPRTIARQAALSIEFSRQENCSRLPSPLPDGRYGDN